MLRKISLSMFLVGFISIVAFSQTKVKADEIIKKLNNKEDAHYENVIIIGDIDFRKINDVEVDGKNGKTSTKTYKYHVNS
ncbi:MAG: hypothetical protein PF487_01415, partial [Bacteroidales bacterium]|nr:hypothetical protein [Bacteroidales bacterium]